MKNRTLFLAAFVLVFSGPFQAPAWSADDSARDTPPEVSAISSGEDALEDDDLDDGFDVFDEEVGPVYDPIEPFNRAMFMVNDKLYFYVLKPVAGGYSRVVPEKGRVAVRRFFTNLLTPVRFVNSVLQFKFEAAGTELVRFAINTTVGVLGFMDPARDRWRIFLVREDFGQTLGAYGAGPGFYIMWPVIGPSSLRDTVGWVADLFLDPTTYIFAADPWVGTGVKAYERVNDTSLEIGTYEAIKKEALDPYVFIRDAYHQHRESLVRE